MGRKLTLLAGAFLGLVACRAPAQRAAVPPAGAPRDLAGLQRRLQRAQTPAERMIAQAELGLAYWRASCPKLAADGSCTTRPTYPVGAPEWCASEPGLAAVPRDPALAAEGLRHLDAAVELWADGELVKGLDPAVADGCTDRAAAVHFALAEARFEEYLELSFPSRLDFAEKRVARSQKRLKAWTDLKNELLVTAKASYQELIDAGTGVASWDPWAVASAARIAQLYQHYADISAAAEVPLDLRREGTDRAKFCAALREVATSLEEEATAGYKYCAEQAEARQVSGPWAELCRNASSR